MTPTGKAHRKPFKVYMCGTAYDWEVGRCDVIVYPSKRMLESENRCVKECGIVCITARPEDVRWIRKPTRARTSRRVWEPVRTRAAQRGQQKR